MVSATSSTEGASIGSAVKAVIVEQMNLVLGWRGLGKLVSEDGSIQDGIGGMAGVVTDRNVLIYANIITPQIAENLREAANFAVLIGRNSERVPETFSGPEIYNSP